MSTDKEINNDVEKRSIACKSETSNIQNNNTGMSTDTEINCDVETRSIISNSLSNTSKASDRREPAISYDDVPDAADFRKTETRVAFVASIDRALKNMGTCIDRMKGNLRETDDAIELVEIRLSHLKEYELKAKRDKEKALKKIPTSRSSLSKDENDTIHEFDDILLAIQGEICDAEKQETKLKLGSNYLQVDLDAIVRSHTEARTRIARSLFHYENNYRALVNSVDDDHMSAFLKNTILETELREERNKNNILKNQVKSLKKGFELSKNGNGNHSKKEQELNEDISIISRFNYSLANSLVEDANQSFNNDGASGNNSSACFNSVPFTIQEVRQDSSNKKTKNSKGRESLIRKTYNKVQVLKQRTSSFLEKPAHR
eukprot:CAMPEP_0194278052 /NCGR_PEP_ID=MMETSP0169-20130528/10206_1 /TAXON_ID=218684 /ORGANISM="Corethron pennatum, Strain L29A3" /LENGTH=374 /DNA_ID=CAMNT_0039022159 /DNA_START=75 /DNA_END=1199 /DNA_ORIENTATION=+